ncbi:MAG: type VI secretion system Vgr family protein, partial [Phycisphaerae bacterium]
KRGEAGDGRAGKRHAVGRIAERNGKRTPMSNIDSRLGLSADTNDYVLRITGMDDSQLRVVAFDAHEALSELFSYRIELCSDDFNLNLEELVGKSACLETTLGEDAYRYVNGILRSIEHAGFGTARGQDGRLAYYTAELVPFHWLLTRRVQSRIFQAPACEDMTVPGIIKKVFTDAGLTDKAWRPALEGSYATLDFVVQYQESDYDFISRLMQREGITFFFEHTEEGCKMVLADSGAANVPVAGDANLTFRESQGLVPTGSPIYAAREQHSVQIGKVTLDDYNFTKPSTQLRVTASAKQNYALSMHEQPASYLERDAGTAYAKIRLEREQCQKRVVRMRGTDRRIEPGYKFTMAEHPRDAMNIEYLIVRSVHSVRVPTAAEQDSGGSGLRHEFEFEVIPATVPFRPARVTPWPRIVGAQTAIVCGPSGEEIYTDPDGYGRVKVQFHWDQEGQYDENSSCWIRVSQFMAGGGYGAMFLPRVGQEVIVEFLEGNPDNPIVTGRMYNAENMPPYKLPDDKTKMTIKSRSTPGGEGFNELRFEDKKDEEQIFLHGQKDLHIRIKKDEFDFIGGKKHETIEGNQAKKIGGAEGRSVGGDLSVKVGGAHSMQVTGESGTHAAGNLTFGTDADLHLVGVNSGLFGDSLVAIDASSVVITADEITLACGGNFIKIDSGGVSIVGSAVNINSGGGAGSAADVAMAATFDPAGPEEPVTGDPGKDVTYQQEATPQEQLEDAPIQRPEDTPIEKHWIGVQLFDDNGEPLVGERYVVVLPDGTKVARGRTDKEGKAEIKGIDPGSCEVQFPDLDGATWETGPAATGGGAAGGGGGVPSASGAPSAPSMPSI